MTYDVFVSYSTQDKLFVDALVNRLENDGIRCWYAPRDIPPGMTWPKAITLAIKNSAIMLLVFSESANASQEVSKELTLASSHKCLVIPVRIENVMPNAELEYHLINRHWLDVYGLEVEGASESILETLRKYENLFANNLAAENGTPQHDPPPAPPRAQGRLAGISLWQRYGTGRNTLFAGMFTIALAAGGAFWLAGSQQATSPPPEVGTETGRNSLAGTSQTLLEKANRNDASAQYALGQQYLEKEPEKAVPWLRKAAEQGHHEAENRLGDLYYSGTGVKASYAEAARWYLRAADGNLAEAQYNLAAMYQQGLGLAPNDGEALFWYGKAADQGDNGACYSLGEMHENGIGVPHNPATAFQWYQRAAERGYAPAQYKIGVMYHSGIGARRNAEEALRWLKRAAEQGDEMALELLRQM